MHQQFIDLTIHEAYQHFILQKRAQGLKEKTLETYVTDFMVLRKYLDMNQSISGLRTRTIQEAVARIADRDVSRNTVRHYTATLKSFLSWCNQEGLCDAQIALFKGEESVPQTYSREELQRLLKRPDLRHCDFGEYRSWVIINLFMNDGCRASTVREIQIRDVHLDESVIYLRHTKNRKALTIPLCDSLIAILAQYMVIRKGKPEEFLFCTLDGKQMSPTALRSSIRRYNTGRGVELASLHAFRHTFARMYLVDCDGDPLRLQKVLGHSTLEMTKHYARLFDADIVKDRNVSPLELLQKSEKIKMPPSGSGQKARKDPRTRRRPECGEGG